MFYCDPCGKDRGWPTEDTALVTLSTRATCEICELHRSCYDVPSSHLPTPPQRCLDNDRKRYEEKARARKMANPDKVLLFDGVPVSASGARKILGWEREAAQAQLDKDDVRRKETQAMPPHPDNHPELTPPEIKAKHPMGPKDKNPYEAVRSDELERHPMVTFPQLNTFLVTISKEYRKAGTQDEWMKANRAKKFIVRAATADDALTLVLYSGHYPTRFLGQVVERRHQPVKGLMEYRWVHGNTRQLCAGVTAL